MWLFHRQPRDWQPPPCICEQVERHVREAIAMREEMARWKTPLEEWLALQTMPVLQLKAEPKPVEDVWAAKYVEVFNRGTQVSTTTGGVFTYTGTSEWDFRLESERARKEREALELRRVLPPPVADSSLSSLAILPSDGDVQPGSILKRGNGWYKVVSVGHDRMTVQRYY